MPWMRLCAIAPNGSDGPGEMTEFEPKDPQFDNRVRASFARQQTMTTLGIVIVWLKPGEIKLKMPYAPAYTQQHGFTHVRHRDRARLGVRVRGVLVDACR